MSTLNLRGPRVQLRGLTDATNGHQDARNESPLGVSRNVNLPLEDRKIDKDRSKNDSSFSGDAGADKSFSFLE